MKLKIKYKFNVWRDYTIYSKFMTDFWKSRCICVFTVCKEMLEKQEVVPQIIAFNC